MTDLRSRREAALDALLAVDTREAYAALAVDAALRRRRLAVPARGYVTEAVYGTLRRRGTIDWMLGQCSDRPLESLHPAVRNALRLAVYEMCFMRTVPGPVACHEAVALTKRRGPREAAGFVNAVCRTVLRRHQADEWAWPSVAEDPVAALSVLTSHPEWLVRRWVERFGVDEARALCEANNDTPPLHLRTNTLKIERRRLAAMLQAGGADVVLGRWAPEALHVTGLGRVADNAAFQAGLFAVQDEGAQLVSHALEPRPGQRVIDLCAAPGGKTTHLAQLMDNQGIIVAVDVHENKLALVRESAARLGVRIIDTVAGDGREMPGRSAPADRVLVDAPCTGLGVVRRRPDLRWRPREEALADLARQQEELLAAAAALTVPGGLIVYSTCSTEPEETVDVVARFLAVHREFAAEPPPPGTCKAGAGGYLFPHRHGTDGFFVARLRRRTDAGPEGDARDGAQPDAS